MQKVRVRFPPSPTGYLHIGSLRTALYNYLFAKKHGGDFILRIEDTDRKRYVEGAVESLIRSLATCGLEWDEGPKLENGKIVEIGENGPYVQSDRLDIYKKYADQLVSEGKAYYCFCTPERLEEVKQAKMAAKQAPMYDGHCRSLSGSEVGENLRNLRPYVIRLKVEKGGEVSFDDAVRGQVKFSTDTVDDQVLMKSDGFPTYHLASVVDDHEMKITHVIRGEEWLSSTPKHILLYEAFGWEKPEFAHLPLLLNSDRSKLSKRQGDVAVEDYLDKGYLKEALINFVALLGWNPGKGSTQEVFSMTELIDNFSLETVNKAGAVFDLRKLDWLNAYYIKILSVEELYQKALLFLEQKEFYKTWSGEDKEKFFMKVLTVEQERLAKLSEIGELNSFFFRAIAVDRNMLKWKDMSDDQARESLQKSSAALENIDETGWTRENLEKILLEVAGEKRGDLLWPLRVSLTGEQKSPGPFEVAWVLGKDESLSRIKSAIKSLE